MATDEQHVYRFGDFALVPRERSLHYRDALLPLTGKAFDLLVALVTNAGHLCDQGRAPGAGLAGARGGGSEPERQHLGAAQSAREVPGAEWIETVPRQGYRFKGPVREDAATRAARRRCRRPVRAWLGRRRRRRWPECSSAASLWVGRVSHYESVVVLPFQVTDPSGAYLADGLTEGLIDKLAQVPGLRVIPRASAFRFRGGDPFDAGRRSALRR